MNMSTIHDNNQSDNNQKLNIGFRRIDLDKLDRILEKIASSDDMSEEMTRLRLDLIRLGKPYPLLKISKDVE